MVFEEIKDETKERINRIRMDKVQTGITDNWCECNATVLIVDDNPFNLMPLNMLLKKLDITVIEAYNGAQAVEKFAENRIQQRKCNCGVGIKLILMDVNMPVMDGCTATQHILKL